MTPGKRLPGERLAGRLSTRLRRAEGLVVATRLSARLARRASSATGIGAALDARIDRWSSSPMLAWFRAVHGSDVPVRWGRLGPETVLAWPVDEPTQDGELASRLRRVRARVPAPAPAGSPSPDSVSHAFRSPPSVSPLSRDTGSAPQSAKNVHGPRPAGDHGPASTFNGRAPGVEPRRPSPMRTRAAPVPRHAAFARAASRAAVGQGTVPLRSHWAGRILSPSVPEQSPMGPRQRRGATPARPRPARLAPGAVFETDPSSGEPGSAGSPLTPADRRLPQSDASRSVRSTSGMHSPPLESQPHRAAARPALRALHRRSQPYPVASLSVSGSEQPESGIVIESSLPDVAPVGRLARALSEHPSRGVILALARAGSPERAAEIAVSHADQLAKAQDLPGPLAEVVQQIGEQLRQAAKASASETPRAAVTSTGSSRSSAPRQRAQRQLDKVVGASGSASVVSLASQRLIRRLQNLVHIAEVDRRQLEAQRQVRMAEDSGQARAQGAAGPGGGDAGDAPPVDLDALRREVLSVVSSIRESRTVRRLEDPDVRIDVF